jgi:hypothetical protein
MLLILLPSYYICCCLCCKVTTKCCPKLNLVPVIQIEIEIARTRHHQLLRRQSHSPEWILTKTLSNFKNRHEVVELFNKMCRQKCIWFQSSNLKSKSRGHGATLLRRQSHLPECILSKTLSNFKNRHEVVEIFNKMCWQN